MTQRTHTTEQVAWEESVPVGQLLDSHFGGRDPGGLAWSIEEVPVAQLAGTYDASTYYAEEADYMANLESAIDAGDVPPPALVRCGASYHHADGAHRTVVAIRRGQTSLPAYVASCPAHSIHPGTDG